MEASKAAMQADDEKSFNDAMRLYEKAIELLIGALRVERDSSQRERLQKRTELNLKRLEQLKADVPVRNAAKLEADAKTAQGRGNFKTAKNKYVEAAQLLIDYKKTQTAPAVLKLLTDHITALITSAELVGSMSDGPLPELPKVIPVHTDPTKAKPEFTKPAEEPKTVVTLKSPEQGQATNLQHNRMSPEELQFLRNSSVICGNRAPIWDDPKVGFASFCAEQASVGSRYIDTNPPKLTQKQKDHNGEWMNAADFLPKGMTPRIIGKVDPLDISQSVVGNCSYVCSLTVAAAYENRHPNAKLITSAIYPQDTSGRPIVSKNGKYAIKLLINGIVRMVTVDERVVASQGKGWVGGPMEGYAVDIQGHRPLSGHCVSGDLWVSLYEKAYLKVFGGSYDFAGSNSSSDLYHLCGWIPEVLELGSVDKDAEWSRLSSCHQRGMLMATMATDKRESMPQSWKDKLGLVACHSYSILDFKEARGIRFLKIMNPWRHHRWLGKYSHQDNVNWTPEIQRALGYDKTQGDNGVFWMCWADATKYFVRINLSWLPHSFKFRFAMHMGWKNIISENNHYFRCPQYHIVIKSQASTASWLLLNRHLPSTFEEDVPYSTIHVFDTTKWGDVRVMNPITLPKDDRVHEGVYVNGASKLVRLAVPAGLSKFTVVVSSLSTKPFPHSLTLYSPIQTITLTRLPDIPFPFQRSVKGEWTSESAGGRCGMQRWRKNPQFRIIVKEASPLVICLELAKESSVGLTISRIEKEVLASQGTRWQGRVDGIKHIAYRSGNYTSSFASFNSALPEAGSSEIPTSQVVPPGVYTIIPTTFEAGQIASFKLSIYSPVKEIVDSLVQLPMEGTGMKSLVLKGSWSPSSREVVFIIYNPSEFTARLIVSTSEVCVAKLQVSSGDVSLTSESCGHGEYLIPFTTLPRASSRTSPIKITATLVALNPPPSVEFQINCFGNNDILELKA